MVECMRGGQTLPDGDYGRVEGEENGWEEC